MRKGNCSSFYTHTLKRKEKNKNQHIHFDSHRVMIILTYCWNPIIIGGINTSASAFSRQKMKKINRTNNLPTVNNNQTRLVPNTKITWLRREVYSHTNECRGPFKNRIHPPECHNHSSSSVSAQEENKHHNWAYMLILGEENQGNTVNPKQ